jgi:aldose 1-epimerase
MALSRIPFGKTPDGNAVTLYTFTNEHGLRMQVSDYGGIVVALETPDRNGTPADVVLGYDSLRQYILDSPYFGAICGRYANRIAQARFTLDGKEYRLAANDAPHALHGGRIGFDKIVWQAEETAGRDGPALRLTHSSPDGDEGYPGNLTVTVTYELTGANACRIEYEATTDNATPINLTNHSYFNLAAGGDILSHELQIRADAYTPVDETLIPTGEIRALDNTHLDFRTPTRIGERLAAVPGGYDHNFVLRGEAGTLRDIAHVLEPTSGRTMTVATTEPGVQLYTGNFLDGSQIGKKGIPYRQHAGFCLETQHFPDSPNRPAFPDTILRPGNTYRQTTEYRFGTDS